MRKFELCIVLFGIVGPNTKFNVIPIMELVFTTFVFVENYCQKMPSLKML